MSTVQVIKAGSLAIRPYITKTENMGLEKYDLVIYPGTKQVESLACIETNGVVRYLTGLDEFAPEIRAIKDDEERAARILSIRTTVAALEKELGSNVIDVADKEFWSKVTILKPNNTLFWNKVRVECENDPVYLNPDSDPMHRILIHAIEAGGFELVAKSLEDAESAANPPKFYLDKMVATSKTKTQSKIVKNEAIQHLQDLFKNDQRLKLMLVSKLTDLDSAQYKYHTPLEVFYNNMDDLINGKGIEKNINAASQKFIDNCTLYSMEKLKMKALVKDAAFYKIIETKANGVIYHTVSGTMLGRNLAEVTEFMLSPINEDLMIEFMESVEKYWNQ